MMKRDSKPFVLLGPRIYLSSLMPPELGTQVGFQRPYKSVVCIFTSVDTRLRVSESGCWCINLSD